MKDPALRMNITSDYADKLPLETRRLVAKATEAEEASSALREAINSQGRDNRVARLDRVLSWPSDSSRAGALVDVVKALGPADHDLVVKALAEMPETPFRRTKLHQIGFDWLRASPDQARRVLSAEIVTRFDQLNVLYESGAVQVIPGMTAEITFR
jgi:hypothetical protein